MEEANWRLLRNSFGCLNIPRSISLLFFLLSFLGFADETSELVSMPQHSIRLLVSESRQVIGSRPGTLRTWIVEPGGILGSVVTKITPGRTLQQEIDALNCDSYVKYLQNSKYLKLAGPIFRDDATERNCVAHLAQTDRQLHDQKRVAYDYATQHDIQTQPSPQASDSSDSNASIFWVIILISCAGFFLVKYFRNQATARAGSSLYIEPQSPPPFPPRAPRPRKPRRRTSSSSSPEPPIIPVTPTPVEPPKSSQLQELQMIMKSCLSVFNKTPIKNLPTLFIESPEHFRKPAIAHFELNNNRICFNEAHLLASFESKTDTMIHELLHCWLHQNGPQDSNKTWDQLQSNLHDDYFELMAQHLGIKFNPEWRNQD